METKENGSLQEMKENEVERMGNGNGVVRGVTLLSTEIDFTTMLMFAFSKYKYIIKIHQDVGRTQIEYKQQQMSLRYN